MSRSRRRILNWTVALGAPGVLAIVGCEAGKPAWKGDSIEFPDNAARLARARELAGEAQDYEKKGRKDEAIEKYKEAVTAYRDYAAAWINLGTLFAEKGLYLEAREAFQVAAEVEPRDPRPYANLGALYQRQRWWDDAARYYAQALDRDPYYEPALLQSVVVDQMRMVRNDTTLEHIRRALEVEQSPALRNYLERQKAVVEGQLRGAL